MSEILTFNLPISISRERWDAIIREAARKVYTEGLVDPGEALMPEVAKAATTALMPPPGTVCGDDQQVLPLPAPVEPMKPAKECGLDRPIPAGAWERMHNYIRARSVPTAALLAQKASIVRWASDGHVEIKIAAPFARQFNGQPAKAALLVDAVREVFGSGSYPRFVVLPDAADAMSKVPVDPTFLRLIDLINSAEWTYDEGGRQKQPAAILWDQNGNPICYMMPRYPGLLFLRHMSDAVRRLLGKHPNSTLGKWLQDGILQQCRTHAKDRFPRFSQNVSVLGEDVTLSRINIAKLEELGLSVNLFKLPEDTL